MREKPFANENNFSHQLCLLSLVNVLIDVFYDCIETGNKRSLSKSYKSAVPYNCEKTPNGS